MPSDPGNVRQRLCEAVRALATSPRPLKHRLAAAGVALAPLKPGNFKDPGARLAFTAVMDSLTSNGGIDDTTAGFSTDQATQIAIQIFDLDSHYRPPSDD